MSTAKEIERIPNAGLFEILATRVLREIDPDCAAIVHGGVNAEGKTIPDPLDGFCLVPGSDPPRYVMSAFTLTATNALLRKWLFEHAKYQPSGKRRAAPLSAADDGDLIKAGREAAAIRVKHPTASFILWLCTNRRLDISLQQPVYDEAYKLGIRIRFLEQSCLRDFLDVKPEGQWLRQEHLGIQADQMSKPLLRKLSSDSLREYAANLDLPSKHEIVNTQAVDSATEALQELGSLDLLLGPSGVGKSVISHSLLRHHLDRNGLGLWLPAEVAERTMSLSDAIDAVVRSLHPRAGVGSGADVLRFGTPDLPLLLVVDDVNRSTNPVGLLRRIIGWARPVQSTTEKVAPQTNSIRIICPAWDVMWFPLRPIFDSKRWIRIQSVGLMRRQESVACLKSGLRERSDDYTNEQLERFAEQIHDDPMLLGLFAKLLVQRPEDNPLNIAEDVIGRMTEHSIGELAAATKTSYVEYQTALGDLCSEMITRKDLHPQWEHVRQWFKSDSVTQTRLLELATQGHVCRLTEIAGVRHLEFRHDRVLEYHLSAAAAGMLSRQTDDHSALEDPFFTPFVGRAIAQVEVPEETLEWIRLRAPVALIAAVSYLPNAASRYADRVVDVARSWFASVGNRDLPIHALEIHAIDELSRSDSPRVLDVINEMPWAWNVWVPQLRNGEPAAAATRLSTRFFPDHGHALVESAVEEARTRFQSRFAERLRDLLRSKDREGRTFGALTLAGYLADPQLADDIKFASESAAADFHLLLPALWAACRCGEEGPGELLGPMMRQVLTFYEESEEGRGRCAIMIRQLGFASRHGFGKQVLNYLVQLGSSAEEFRWIVAEILSEVDHPIAIEYIVPLLADQEHSAKRTGGISPWAMMWRLMRQHLGSTFSGPSVAALKVLWLDAQVAEYVGDYAFSLWAQHVADVSEIAEIKPNSRYFEAAIWQRAVRRDRRVAQNVLDIVANDPRWFEVVARIWGAEFVPVIDAALGRMTAEADVKGHDSSNECYAMSHLLRDIPTVFAEPLLTKHWVGLSRSKLFVFAALYHGTPMCCERVAASVAHVPQADDLFEDIGSFFGFGTDELMGRLRLKQLEALLPYLSNLDDMSVNDMLDWCRRFGQWKWAKKHIEPEIRRRVPVASHELCGDLPFVKIALDWFPTNKELLAELDELEGRDPEFDVAFRWWDKFVERGDNLDRPGQVLLEWLGPNPPPSRFVRAARLIDERGSRADLQGLLKVKPTQEDNVVNRALIGADFGVKRRSLE
jgi:hypothetical protein